MAKKNTFNWGKASMIAGASVFFYLAFRKPAQSADYVPSKVPTLAINPSIDDPKHWAYQLRPGKPNPGYDMSNYSKDMFEIGEALNLALVQNNRQDTLVKGYQFCDLYGPYNDLQSPYGPRIGFVVELFKVETKDDAVSVDPDLGDYSYFASRLFVPVWIPHPKDQKFADLVANPYDVAIPGVTVAIDGKIYGNSNSRAAYDPSRWVVPEFVSSTEPIGCTQNQFSDGDILAGREPRLVAELRKYKKMLDARDDL